MRIVSLIALVTIISLNPTVAVAAPVPIDSSVFDKADNPDTKYGIGITFSIAQRPFKSVDDQFTSLPYLSFQYKNFYIEGTNVGYKFINKDNYGLEFLITPRYYESQESFAKNGDLDGIDKTKQTFLAGISSQFKTDFATYTVQVLKDLGKSNGSELTASASKVFKVSNSVSLSPAIGLTWQDSNLVDHFYGVQANEVRNNRPLYQGQSSLNSYVLLTAVWNMTKQVQLLGQIKHEFLGSGITRSPIVDERSISSYVLGTFYRF